MFSLRFSPKKLILLLLTCIILISLYTYYSSITRVANPYVSKNLPWYFSNGDVYPVRPKTSFPLFYEQNKDDRIVKQLMYVPNNYQRTTIKTKNILLYGGPSIWGNFPTKNIFNKCPVSKCTITYEVKEAEASDAIIFKTSFIESRHVVRPSKQLWILYLLECPFHTPALNDLANLINWTATYRSDSDIVAPYAKWVYYDDQVTQKTQPRNYAANKTKKVAWFVSNCGAQNGRLAYARELGNYISVDIYGSCGTLKCPRTDRRCFEILERDYKFYLAFENSNCRDYITEKFYVNGLGQAVLPIVMGARPEDYERRAPERSYIHVDDFGNPEELATYLHQLDKDDELYNSYFKWKGTGEFINTYFWCRLCAMMHAPLTPRHYEDVNEWWRGPGVCTESSWRVSPP